MQQSALLAEYKGYLIKEENYQELSEQKKI
jgi:hypothetical protein